MPAPPMTAMPASVPAPSTGWNTRDALDGMPPTDAVRLDNWIPGINKVYVRAGYASHATGVGAGAVQTVAEYHSGATRKLIACGGGAIYDATSAGAATSKASDFSVNVWHTANFSGTLFFFNGTDAPQEYDGSTVSGSSWSGSGLTPANLSGVNVFKNRLFMWDSDTQDFWYASVNAVSGALTKFPLSRITGFGGNLTAMATWTVDSGSGPDDYAVFIMSSGDVVVYAGTDPGDANAWSLQGIYHIGQPLDKRAVLRIGGDLLIATTDDYVSLTKVFRAGHLGGASKLSGAVQAAATSNKAGTGWQGILSPKHGLALFNVPNVDGSFDQHVLNTTTGAPCRFKAIPANCWGLYNDDLYFGGGGGVVYKYTGEDDASSAIEADAIQAWSMMGSPYRKRVAAIRHILDSVASSLSYETDIGFDFGEIATPSPSVTSSTSAPWDTSPWDTTPWSSSSVIDASWRVASGTGQSVAARVRVNTKTPISWLRTDYRVEIGKNL